MVSNFYQTSLFASWPSSSTMSIPETYMQVMKHECWQQTMTEELNALDKNFTWDIYHVPSMLHQMAASGCT